jgi:hypothetical protein
MDQLSPERIRETVRKMPFEVILSARAQASENLADQTASPEVHTDMRILLNAYEAELTDRVDSLTVERTQDEFGEDRYFVADSLADWIGDAHDTEEGARNWISGLREGDIQL